MEVVHFLDSCPGRCAGCGKLHGLRTALTEAEDEILNKITAHDLGGYFLLSGTRQPSSFTLFWHLIVKLHQKNTGMQRISCAFQLFFIYLQEREHTQKELEKLNACRDFLKQNGVFDQDSFIDFFEED